MSHKPYLLLVGLCLGCERSHDLSDAGAIGSAKAIEIHDLESLESTISAKLPDDYRKFLLKGDLSVPKKSFFWVVRGDWGSGIDELYGFAGSPNLVEEYADRRAEKIPADLLPIGDDGMAGTSICLGIQGQRRGKVYFVDTTGTEVGKTVPNSAVHKIGDSFSAWFSRLEVDPEE